MKRGVCKIIPYVFIDKIMTSFFHNQMFHRPIDKILEDVNHYKPKYHFPCEKEQQIKIEGKTIFLHHYQCKYSDIILFFPGGSFIDPPTILHANFAKKIAKKLKKHVIMVQYPLFPEVNPLYTTQLMRKMIETLKLQNITLMGDSAGACLALYVLHSYHMDKKDVIQKTILISPWFDGAMTNEEIPLIQPHDFILEKDNCYTLAKRVFSLYIDGKLYLCPKNDGFVFPSEVLMITGGHEIFTPDAILWTKEQKVLNVRQLVYKNMCHCFIILPIWQANHAIKKIKFFLENKEEKIDYFNL